jgi:signal transduction protein with GAF and PtsI domain
VTFTDKYLRERVGTVIRLNDRTVSVLCDGVRRRVTRRILRKIIDV